MKAHRMAALSACLLLWTVLLAHSVSKNNTIRIRVLASETHSVSSRNDVPQNCDSVNFDAYCHSGRTTEMTNTLLVQESDGTPFRVVCTVETKWSRCVPLPKDETFNARKEKRGLVVFYPDDTGKLRSQLYTFVDAPREAGGNARKEQSLPAEKQEPAVEATGRNQPATVRCKFDSTPAGADVTVDGRYVGSTPSVVGLDTGSHVVVIKMTGFADWKRQLDVSADSELTVNAVLQKGK